MGRNKAVRVLGLGGTITGETKEGKSVYETVEIEDKIYETSEIIDKIPEIERVADLQIDTLFNIDSSNIQPHMWKKLAEKIFMHYNECDGIVVTTGTDTLNYTAAALSLMLQNLGKPVVVTGAQVPFDGLGSDVRRNFVDAIRVAANANLGEVITVFSGKILRGNRTRKYDEERFDAFASVGYPPLGRIEYDIKLTGYGMQRDDKKIPLLKTEMCEDVFLLKIFPGMNPDIIDAIISIGYKGLVIEGFGAGNVPILENSIIPKIEYLTSKNIPVVVSTQCADGASWMHKYQCGRKALEAGAIPSYDTISETALIKLMWIMGQTRDMHNIKSLFLTNFAGELSTDMIKNRQKILVLK